MSTTDQILINLEDEVNPNENNSGKRKNYDENSSVKKVKQMLEDHKLQKKLYNCLIAESLFLLDTIFRMAISNKDILRMRWSNFIKFGK